MVHSPYFRVFVPLVLLLSRAALAEDSLTALDRYVAAPDPAYSYKLVDTIKGAGHTGYVLEMTSQSWLTEKEVDKPVWKHWMTIVRPDEVATSKAMLMISGGSNARPAPKTINALIAQVAINTKSVVAELRMVPNQPLTFVGDGKARSEDSLIAFTWDKYLRSGDERWPARLPMTKAAVRAMDTVTSFCAGEEGGKIKVDSFVVAGASKRGWTTWTTAAVDKRVAAVIPIVIDTLNVELSATHHFEAYGFWAPSLKDYVDMKIVQWAGTPQYKALLKIEDPYEYRARLTMPKFIINAAGDQFFVPDGSRFYFDQLPGVKYLRYVPNADHGLRNSDAPFTLLACYNAILTGAALPRFTWTAEKDGSLRVKAEDQPSAVKLWQATNPAARDFRIETFGAKWTSTDLTAEAGAYVGKVAPPEKGWTAFLVELTFPSKDPAMPPFKFTTDVRIVPDVLPFKFKRDQN